jgi:hypothetical protein
MWKLRRCSEWSDENRQVQLALCCAVLHLKHAALKLYNSVTQDIAVTGGTGPLHFVRLRHSVMCVTKTRQNNLTVAWTICNGKVFPLQAWTGPWGSGRLRLRIFSTFGTIKVVRSSSLRTGRIYPQ